MVSKSSFFGRHLRGITPPDKNMMMKIGIGFSIIVGVGFILYRIVRAVR